MLAHPSCLPSSGPLCPEEEDIRPHRATERYQGPESMRFQKELRRLNQMGEGSQEGRADGEFLCMERRKNGSLGLVCEWLTFMLRTFLFTLRPVILKHHLLLKNTDTWWAGMRFSKIKFNNVSRFPIWRKISLRDRTFERSRVSMYFV